LAISYLILILISIIFIFKEFKENMKNAGVDNVVEPLLKASDEAAQIWKEPIEFLYLDVNYHDYELSKNDLADWSKHVIDGGTIAIHNTYPDLRAIIFENQPLFGWPGPRRVLKEFVFGSKNFKNIGIVSNITYATKCNQNTFLDRLRGRLTQLKGFFSLFALKIYLILVQLPQPVKKFVKRLLFRAKN